MPLLDLLTLETVKSVILIVMTCNCLPFSWSTVCATSKEKEANPPFEIGVYTGVV